MLTMNWLCMIAILFMLLDGQRCKEMKYTTVRLNGGMEVRGKNDQVDGRTVREFLGIPYAEPPKRFAPPKESSGWEGILDATTRKPACWQPILDGFDKKNKGAKMWLNNTVMDEDCLYLNVWAPEISNSLYRQSLPVMVWIYGGGFYSGSSYLDVYDGKFLAGTQDVIVVSMQYRVGPFGFLFFNLTGEGNSEEDQLALGNQGLLDQAMALKWIKENIEHFNGDKNSITIFGESAGAVSVSLLWLSPVTKQYINRAILESGSALARWGISTPEDAHSRSEKFAELCNCTKPSQSRSAALECLRDKKPEELVEHIFTISNLICENRNETIKRNLDAEYHRLEGREYSTCLYFDAPLRPVQYQPLFPRNISSLLAEKSEKAPELLLGVNKNEGMYFLLYGLAVNNTLFLEPEGTVNLPDSMKNEGSRDAQAGGEFTTISIAEIIDTDLMVSDKAEEPAKFYKLDKESVTAEEKLMNRFDHMTGDLDFICPTIEFADQVSQINNAKVYLYSFEKRTAGFPMPEWVGVMHGYEIEYVFGMPLSLNFTGKFYGFTPQEGQLSRKVMKLWANFAKSGDPNMGQTDQYSVINWPKYDQSTKTHLVIGETFQTGTRLREDACTFWKNLKK